MSTVYGGFAFVAGEGFRGDVAEVLRRGNPSPEVLPAYVAEFLRCGVCNLVVFKANAKLPNRKYNVGRGK